MGAPVGADDVDVVLLEPLVLVLELLGVLDELLDELLFLLLPPQPLTTSSNATAKNASASGSRRRVRSAPGELSLTLI